MTSPDRVGIPGIVAQVITPNGRCYAYFYPRTLSDLYLVEGLR